MKKLFVIAALLVGVSACNGQAEKEVENNNSSSQEATVKQIAENISVKPFATKVASVKGQLIDVRTQGEYAEGHIAGATNIDIYSETFESEISNLDKNTPVYVYCRSGGRSGKAMSIMKAMGFVEVYNLDGGMNAWQSSNQAVEK